ncbi:MAG TPA: hypothetical protein VI072_15905 [Polyangiaceae bacterium]
MNWLRVDELLKDCQKWGAAGSVPASVPTAYAKVLERYNGVEGFVGPEQYLMLWRAEQIEELNIGYSVAEYLPGVVLIGTDGADTGFGVDTGGAYVSVPLVGMSPKETKSVGASFDAFLEHLASGEG